MGREWLYWIGRATRRRRTSAGIINQDDAASPGCMCAVFHLFDQHHFNLPLNHQHSLTPYLQQEVTTTTFKGVEAPRNSLEMEEPPPPPPTLKIKEEDNLNFLAGIQIKTRSSVSASKEECSLDSPGTKTPSLVARLMGLDLLPETDSSPSPSISKPQAKSQLKQSSKDRSRCFYEDDINVGARSLPEANVEYHRLSLQINKDNANQEFAKTRFRQQDENRSPGHYAKQIVKQVRESVSRRVVGLDITNTNRVDSDEIRRDQSLLLKLSKTKQSTTPSSSPKLRILDTKKNKPAAETTTKSPRNSTSSDTNPPKPKHQEHHPHNKIGSSVKKLSPHQNCDQAIINKKDEAFVRSPANKASLKKSKNAPLSSESGPTILPVKKGPSPPATKLPQKQAQVSDALSSKRNTQLSSNTSRSYKQLPLRHHHHHPDKIFTVPENVLPDSTNGCATSAAEFKCYIQKILKRAGIIDKLTPLTLGKWHTPSHPLDPSIFYYLELFHPAASSSSVLSRRCNRKLIFQLVDELLVDILRPHLDYRPWISPAAASASDHLALVDELCRKIESFPGADCRVLEDIDLLVDKDLGKSPLCLDEEGERLVREIEGEIVERLVSETVAAAVVDGVRTGRQKGWTSRGPGSSHVTRCH